MQKIDLIVFLVIILSGCSVARRGTDKSYINAETFKGDVSLDSIVSNNLSKNNFHIKKAEFKISSQIGTRKGMGSIIFETSGKYLISVRSTSGIEIGRVFLSEDTILINDRINRKLYYGSQRYIKAKYGISAEILPLIVGDYINKDLLMRGKKNCEDGKLYTSGSINDINITYVIDCKLYKAILASSESGYNKNKIVISYEDFMTAGGINLPGTIRITDSSRETTIEIRIKDIETPWKGTIEFIPGNRYELIQLL